MQELHLVGFTADHERLIFAGRRGSKSGGFVIAVDEALIEHVDELRRRHGDPSSTNAVTGSGRKDSRAGANSSLTPREMQSRLRAGKSVAEVAGEAGVDASWVERFAAPILAEQAQAVSRASDFIFTTARRGASSLPLAESIAANLAAKGVTLSSSDIAEAWSSHQDKGSAWVVRFTYKSKGHVVQAEWLADLVAKTLNARNRPASELGFVESGRTWVPVQDLFPPARPATRPAAARTGEVAAVEGPMENGSEPSVTSPQALGPAREGAKSGARGGSTGPRSSGRSASVAPSAPSPSRGPSAPPRSASGSPSASRSPSPSASRSPSPSASRSPSGGSRASGSPSPTGAPARSATAGPARRPPAGAAGSPSTRGRRRQAVATEPALSASPTAPRRRSAGSPAKSAAAKPEGKARRLVAATKELAARKGTADTPARGRGRAASPAPQAATPSRRPPASGPAPARAPAPPPPGASGPPVRMRRPRPTPATGPARTVAASTPSVALTIRAPRADETNRLAVVSGAPAASSAVRDEAAPRRAAAGSPAPGFRMRRSERSAPQT